MKKDKDLFGEDAVEFDEKDFKNFDYIEEAQVTLSDLYFGEFVSKSEFMLAVSNAITALEELDKLKKILFYGRDCIDEDGAPIVEMFPKEYSCASLADTTFKQTILHGIVGKATESGELLELLQSWLKEGGNLDVVNLREEVGDGFWYDAILTKACGFNFGEAQRINIEKLRARFPNSFETFDANNRNLEKEREILSK